MQYQRKVISSMPKWQYILAAVLSSLCLSSTAAAEVPAPTGSNQEILVTPQVEEFHQEQEATPSVSQVRPAPQVQSAESAVAKLPVATNAKMAESNQAAIAVKVKAAIAAGHGKQLLERTNSPDVAADLLRYGTVTTKVRQSPKSRREAPAFTSRRKVTTAHSAGCYGSPWSQQNYTEFGATVAWIYVRENGWCGSNGRITWYGGPTFANWTWGPFCLGSRGSNYTWDYPYSWIHMAYWASLGTSYPWGCLTYHGGKVQIRIAWNGYWDEYNDYGF